MSKTDDIIASVKHMAEQAAEVEAILIDRVLDYIDENKITEARSLLRRMRNAKRNQPTGP